MLVSPIGLHSREASKCWRVRLFSVHDKPGIQLQRMLLDTLGTLFQLETALGDAKRTGAQASGPVFDWPSLASRESWRGNLWSWTIRRNSVNVSKMGSLSFSEPESHGKDEHGIGIGSVKIHLFFCSWILLTWYVLLVSIPKEFLTAFMHFSVPSNWVNVLGKCLKEQRWWVPTAGVGWPFPDPWNSLWLVFLGLAGACLRTSGLRSTVAVLTCRWTHAPS